MGFHTRAASGGSFAPAPEGTHAAVCTRLIDLGTQETQFGPKRRVQVGWEIDERREDGQRFMAFAHYTLSMHEKAALRKMLEQWRGRSFDDDEEFFIGSVLGKGCLITLVKNGDYTNVSAVASLMKNMVPLQPEGPTILIDLDELDLGELDKLGDRQREKIEATPEYRAAVGKGRPDPKSAEYAGVHESELDDDIPF